MAYFQIKCQQLIKYELLHKVHINGAISWIVVIWNILVYWKWDFYNEFMLKWTAVSHITKYLIVHYSLTCRFTVAEFITQLHQGTYYVDQIT